MKWIMITVILIVCYLIYSKWKNTVTLTKDQAEVALEAIKENLESIEKERQEIIKEHSLTVLGFSMEKSLELRKNNPIENKIAELISKISFFFNKLGFKGIANRLYIQKAQLVERSY